MIKDNEITEAVLLECRSYMTERTSSLMSTMMNEAEKTLFDIATKEKGIGKAAQYFDAARIVKIKKDEIQVRFENRLISLFKYRIQNVINTSDTTDITISKIGYSSFMKDTDSTEGKMISNALKRVRKDCYSALLNLDKKVNALICENGSNQVDNPVQPDVVYEAFWESCREVEIKLGIRLILFNLFEKYVAFELKYIYEDMNTYLSGRYKINNDP
jgi:hypothetical protein